MLTKTNGMFHHPIANLLKKAFLDSVKEQDRDGKLFGYSRRKFMRDSLYAAGGTVLIPSFLQNQFGKNEVSHR